MNTETQSWAVHEFCYAKLGDLRRTKRLIRLAEQRANYPNASIPQACGDAAATQAAYRFYDNPDIEGSQILKSHQQVTQERLAKEPVVLAVQDTTQLDLTHHPNTKGLGVLADATHHGVFVHTTLAVTPGRVPLGVIEQQTWIRPPEEIGKRHQRRSRPLSEKESQKWLNSLAVMAQMQKQLPHTHLINVGDREASGYDLFLSSTIENASVLVRAAWDRCVAHPEGHLWAYLESRPVAATLTITVPRQPSHPARTALLTVRYAPVTLRPPQSRYKEKLSPLPVWAVFAHEDDAPVGMAAVSWLLLTTVPTETVEAAFERIQWYTCRWVVEVYHKVLKSGCRVEERQFEDITRLERYLALDSIVAWRVLFLTLLGREQPHLPCTALLEAHEWQALYCFIHHTHTPPLEPPTLQAATRWIGQLGGFLSRKRDGEPGVTTIWRGLQRLKDLALAWQLFHPLSTSTQKCG
jgi:hypothetical protein